MYIMQWNHDFIDELCILLRPPAGRGCDGASHLILVALDGHEKGTCYSCTKDKIFCFFRSNP